MQFFKFFKKFCAVEYNVCHFVIHLHPDNMSNLKFIIMKKIFSIAILAAAFAMVGCAGNANKKAEEVKCDCCQEKCEQCQAAVEAPAEAPAEAPVETPAETPAK